jgi:hypothetical protein
MEWLFPENIPYMRGKNIFGKFISGKAKNSYVEGYYGRNIEN